MSAVPIKCVAYVIGKICTPSAQNGKRYPAGATTNSTAGVTDVRKIWPVLGRSA